MVTAHQSFSFMLVYPILPFLFLFHFGCAILPVMCDDPYLPCLQDDLIKAKTDGFFLDAPGYV